MQQVSLKALVLGLDYTTRPPLRLTSCVNDAFLARRSLLNAFYNGAAAHPNVVTYADALGDCFSPRRVRLVGAVERMLQNSREGDVVLIHFSGHGTQVFDADGKVIGEALVPSDVIDNGTSFSNLITGQDLANIILANMPIRVTLYIVLDCCFGNGAIQKLKAQLQGVSLPHNPIGGASIRAAFPQDIAKKIDAPEPPKSDKFISFAQCIQNAAVQRQDSDIIVLTANSKGEQVADVIFNYNCYGIFSYYLYTTLSENDNNISNAMLPNHVKEQQKNLHNTQIPQLIATHNDEEHRDWRFLSRTPANVAVNVGAIKSINSISVWENLLTITPDIMQDLHAVDISATLEVVNRCKGKNLPCEMQDIARVIGGIAGFAMRRIARKHGLKEDAVAEVSNACVKACINRYLEYLLEEATALRLELEALIVNVAIFTVTKITETAIGKGIDINQDVTSSYTYSFPTFHTASLQPITSIIRLVTKINFKIGLSERLAPAIDLVNDALRLVIQVVCALCVLDLQIVESNAIPKEFELIAIITHYIKRRITPAFVHQVMFSQDLRQPIEQGCMETIQDIVSRQNAVITKMELQQRVTELTGRFYPFIFPTPGPELSSLVNTILQGDEIKIPSEEPDFNFDAQELPDDCEAIARKVVAIYSGETGFMVELIWTHVVRAVKEVMESSNYKKFPRNFVLEAAKMVGCGTANGILVQLLSGEDAIDEALTNIQNFLPSNAPLGYQQKANSTKHQSKKAKR